VIVRVSILDLVIMFTVVAGCTSPEATRTRGGGPGADVGNRAKTVQMHEGSKPYAETPQIIPTKHASTSPAAQAHELSRK
jgi:hypothetical protein